MAESYKEPEPKPELEFPVTCHFKVIAEDLDGMDFVIETVLIELGVSDPVTSGNRSSTGKYVTYNVSVVVDSRDAMNRIDQALREIQGVKMVL